jgi:methionyl-tRNA formyltransferase
MRRLPGPFQSLDIVLFGMPCRFTAQILTALVQSGHSVKSVILPRHGDQEVQVMLPQSIKPRIAMVQSGPQVTVLPNVAALAWSAGAALIETGHDQLSSLPARFATLRQGIVVSACFPWQVPPEVLDAPPLGCLNIHPSLLPQHRGPDPLFWAFHAGDRQTGVTIHRMTTQLDAGPILVQQRIDLPLETRYSEADQQTIMLSSRLIVQALDGLAAGTLEGRDQPAINASYESHADDPDLLIDISWPAERAFRFVHGVEASYGLIQVTLPDGEQLPVIDAETLHPGRSLGRLFHRSGNHVAVQFEDGVVTFLAPE